MIKKYWKVALVVIFFVGIVPIIINESYKAETIYVTVWNAEDVLAYYGVILGSVVTVGVLAATIAFTRKQIQRESFLNWENEKWDRLDAVFMKILDSVNPIEVLKSVMDTGYTDPYKAINHLQKFQMTCRISCDQLNTNLCAADYPKFKKLIDSTAALSEEFVQISQRLIDIYSDFQSLKDRDTAFDTLAFEKEHPGSFSQENISFSQDILKKTENMTLAEIKTQVTEANDLFIKTYETKYRELLQLKGSTFEVVRIDTRKYADDILSWRRK